MVLVTTKYYIQHMKITKYLRNLQRIIDNDKSSGHCLVYSVIF